MSKSIEEQALVFEQHIEESLPGSSIDCVILGYKEQQLKILLLRWKYEAIWSLPGGFIHKTEDMDEAAHRILKERTGLSSIFLKQFYTFGNKNRKPEDNTIQQNAMLRIMKKFPFKNVESLANWLGDRFITTGYFALVNIDATIPEPDFISEKCEWKNLEEAPELLLDHREIIQKALNHLRIQLNYLPIGLSLLPQKFTMYDFQKLYEAILQKPLERSNFQRKMLKLGFLIRHEKLMKGAPNKAPFLYSFDKEKYYELLRNGIGFSI